MKKQNRNDPCNCGSGKQYKKCCQKNNLDVSAEHITFLGSCENRSTTDIHQTTIEHFKQFQINNGRKISSIDRTPFDCELTVKEDVAVFTLSVDGSIVTKNVCCFGKNQIQANKILDEVKNEYLSNPLLNYYYAQMSKNEIRPSKEYWLYTFIMGFDHLYALLTCGEIEFYIYDAIRRGILKNTVIPDPVFHDPMSVIRKWSGNDLFTGFDRLDNPYPLPLPEELEQWHVYVGDCGHSILCLLQAFIDKINDPDIEDHLIPVPVKAVLRGYRIENNIVIVDLPYSEELGLMGDEEDDDEF